MRVLCIQAPKQHPRPLPLTKQQQGRVCSPAHFFLHRCGAFSPVVERISPASREFFGGDSVALPGFVVEQVFFAKTVFRIDRHLPTTDTTEEAPWRPRIVFLFAGHGYYSFL